MATVPFIARDTTPSESALIQSCSGLQQVWQSIQMVGPTSSAVLIEGETGTGKELAARAIHQASRRNFGPFVTINCAAIPSGLLESQLFGHERGAFTGAVAQTAGRFQAADRGTLFLDEIGDMPLELQPKLLRVLQEQEFERLGSTKTIKVDVRVVAATNQDLAQLVREHRFRADLYYRLNVFPIAIPPLRERPQDIPQLVRHFGRKFAWQMNKETHHITDEVMAALMHYHWPGNVRELQNLMERAVILSSGPNLHLPLGELKSAKKLVSPAAPAQTLADAEREHIVETLRQVGWVVGGRAGAAARLGVPRTTLLYRMRKLGIEQRRAVAVAAAV